MHKAKDAMNDTAELKNPLHIGTIESLCTVKLPGNRTAVSGMNIHRLEFRSRLVLQNSLIQKMEHNELDVIYILDTPRWNKNWVKVMEKAEPVIFVSAPNYKLAGKKDIKDRRNIKCTILSDRTKCKLQTGIRTGISTCDKQTLSPVLECSDTAFIKKMLKTGKGLSYLPLFVVEKDIEEGKIAKLDVKDIDITMYRQVFYHANKYMTKEMEKFVEYCKF